MSLIISDLHGNYAKCKAFIEYKPEEEHIILGDFIDSYPASDADIIATFKLAVDSNCVCLCGNHELPYLSNAHAYFRCSGNRYSPELFHVVNLYKDLLHGSLVRDNYLLVHGGLSRKHGKPFKTIEDASAWINAEFAWYLAQPVAPESLSSIFDIGSTLNQSLCHPREIFKSALMVSCAAIAILHNHPSGDTTPSSEDIAITRRLKEASEIIGIKLLDHLIVSDTEYTSFVERGLL